MYWVTLHTRPCAGESDRPESCPEEITGQGHRITGETRNYRRGTDNGLKDYSTIIAVISVLKGNKRVLEKQLTGGPKSVGNTRDQGWLLQ